MKRPLLVLVLALASCTSGEPDALPGLSQDSMQPPPSQGATVVTPVADEPAVAHVEAGIELPAQRVQEFTCTPEAVGDEMVVAGVSGSAQDVVTIRPSARTECLYDLVYRGADGDHVLSTDASGYLFTMARRDGDLTIVCANDVVHSELDPGRRHIDQVAILCATRRDGDPWSPLEPAVVPEGDYAAWLRGLAPHPGGYQLTWARDFSYQPLNLTDAGRPPEDGIYNTVLALDGDRVAPAGIAKVSDRTNPLAEAEFEKWEPSADEQAAMGEFIDFSEGPCPHGCSLP